MKLRNVAPNLVLWFFPVVIVGLIVGATYSAFMLGDLITSGERPLVLFRKMVTPILVVVFLAVRQALRHKGEPAQGVEITMAQHPKLWAEVNALARIAQTAPPSRIVMVLEVNAAVTEASGQREMIIGMPLLSTLTRGELRAVLAHEFGHFAGGDTAAAARIMRRITFLNEVRDRAHPIWRWFFTGYVRLYELAAGPVSREAELRADQLSLTAAGPKASADAHRSVIRTGMVWNILTQQYTSLFALSGLRAPMGDGIRALLTANAEALDEAVPQFLAEEKLSARDTHPPTRERIAAFETARSGGAFTVHGHEAASDLLTGGMDWISAVEGEMLVVPYPLATWDEVIARGIQQQVTSEAEQTSTQARQFGMGSGSLGDLLTIIDTPEEDSTPESTASVLSAPVLSALLDVGMARVVPSWAAPASFSAPDGSPLGVWDRILAAATIQDSSELRAWLTESGINPSTVHPATSVPIWLAAASHVKGPWKGQRDVHIWTTGVVALPVDKATIKRDRKAFSDKHQHPRLAATRIGGCDAARRVEDAFWLDASQIVASEISGKMRIRFSLRISNGESHEFQGTVETAIVDSAKGFGDAIRFVSAPKVASTSPAA